MNLESVESLLEKYQNILIELDLEGRVTWLGQGWTPLTGRPIDDCRGRRFAELVLEPHRTGVEDALAALLSGRDKERKLRIELATRGGEEGLVDVRLLCIQVRGRPEAIAGSLNPVSVVVIDPLRDGHVAGEVRSLSSREALETDVTRSMDRARRQAERLRILADTAHELNASTTDYRGLLRLVARCLTETIGDACAVSLVSDDGRWLNAVAWSHRLEADDTALRRVLAPARVRVSEGVVGVAAQRGEPVFIPVVRLDPPSHPCQDLLSALVSVKVSSFALMPLNVRGRSIGLLTLARRDVPDRAYTEEDRVLLQDLADRAALAIENARVLAELEQRVKARTADLQAANRELEAFSYSASHDLRAPLRSLDCFLSALDEDYGGLLPEEGRDFVARARQATGQMAALIDDLLRLARATRAEMSLETVDLTALADGIVADLRRADPTRQVDVEVARGLSVRGDPRLFQIALENLLSNAWKFSGRTAKARIDVGMLEQDGARVFFVRDNGSGFDMAYGAKLFTAFQRLHTQDEYPGTGVGLATVKRIVERHGGSIWAESAEGQGATFFFRVG